MKRALLTAVSLITALENTILRADESALALPRQTPESQGISSRAILSFIEAADQQIDALHSFMLVRHGAVVAEGWWSPYDAATRHELYSLSKSFTSTAVGLAATEGRLSTNDLILSFFPNEAPAEPSAQLKAMRIRDLLAMSTGHQNEPAFTAENAWTKTFLAEPVPHKPGTHFLYNTAATYMLSAIVQKVSGETVLDYLRPRLFEPLGIEHPSWGTSPQGVSLGGYGLSVRTEDIARLGQLYLQKGEWHGRQILPAAWVAAATSRQSANGSDPNSDWEQGYGFQFWRCRHGAFRGDGAFGQYCLVLPEQDAVVAITSGVKDMQAVLNLVWDKLLPALQPKSLEPDGAAQEQLKHKLAGLVLPMPKGSASVELTRKILGRTFSFPANTQGVESLSLEKGLEPEEVTIRLRNNGIERRLPCGFNHWRKSRLAYGALDEQPVALCGAWTGTDAFKAKLCFSETPFCLTLTLQFAGDQLLYDSEYNVGFGATKRPRLIGAALN